MSINEQNKGATRAELRKFGFTMAIAFGIIAGLLLWRGRPYWMWFGGLAGAFAVAGAAVPVVLRPINWAWMGLAHIMGAIMTRVILCISFYLVLTPMALLLWLMGKDLLDIRAGGAGRQSYWKHKPASDGQPRDYQRQF